MSTPTLTDALTGAQYNRPEQTKLKTVLVAGAAGRLGERILTRLLGMQEYRRIYVLASDEMRSTEAKLTALTLPQWTCSIDHVIAVVDERSSDTIVSGHKKRTGIFSTLTAEQVMPLAQRAESLGVARFMLVTPTDVLAQPAAVYAQIANLMEAELHRLRFESLLLVRPSDHEIRQRRGSIAKRLTALLVDTATGLMAGLKHTPISLEDTARAVVRAMLDSAKGLHIIEMDRLHQILKL